MFFNRPYNVPLVLYIIASLIAPIVSAGTTEEAIKAIQLMDAKYKKAYPNSRPREAVKQIGQELDVILKQWDKSSSVDGLVELLQLASQRSDLYAGNEWLYYIHKATNKEKGDTLANWILQTKDLSERRKLVYRTMDVYAIDSPLLRQVLAEFLDDRTRYQRPGPLDPAEHGWPVRNWAHNVLYYCAGEYGLTKGDRGATTLITSTWPDWEDECIAKLKERMAANPDLFPKVADVEGISEATPDGSPKQVVVLTSAQTSSENQSKSEIAPATNEVTLKTPTHSEPEKSWPWIWLLPAVLLVVGATWIVLFRQRKS